MKKKRRRIRKPENKKEVVKSWKKKIHILAWAFYAIIANILSSDNDKTITTVVIFSRFYLFICIFFTEVIDCFVVVSMFVSYPFLNTHSPYV